MTDSDQLLRRARSELIPGGTDHRGDPGLWDHSQRVMTNAEMIARFPEVRGKKVNLEAVRVAALYHDAGWAVQVKVGQVGREQVLTRPTNDVQFELAAELVESSLGDLLPTATLRRAAEVIRKLNSRQCELVERDIVLDADNLDQIGPLWLMQNLRRHWAGGRSMREVLDVWHRQQEYHYWEARIRDGICFESVRKIAWKRLESLGPFMQALDSHVGAEDLAEIVEPTRMIAEGRPEASSQ
ncbi:MAG: HD domain-containing protein [Phycisphaerae bacterium]|nr:HD domain-containing protein [Phycisphaerae bacterium]